MSVPIAHAGHWLINSLYFLPFAVIVGALGVQRMRDKRRGGPSERAEPTLPPPGSA